MNASVEPVAISVTRVDRLDVQVYASVEEMAVAAGRSVARTLIRKAAGRRAAAFASAPSQIAFIDRLAVEPGLPWTETVVFHLDEYVGMSGTHPASFARFLQDRLFARVRPVKAHLIDGMASSPEGECVRYSQLLAENPLTVACIGVGENGHIAFNEPDDTDFSDTRLVRLVSLDEVSRHQQVRDGCFASLDEVPREAITLTVPAIMAAQAIRCVVIGPQKAAAVSRMLGGPVTPSCPASVLRRHRDAVLFLDQDAASSLDLRRGEHQARTS